MNLLQEKRKDLEGPIVKSKEVRCIIYGTQSDTFGNQQYVLREQHCSVVILEKCCACVANAFGIHSILQYVHQYERPQLIHRKEQVGGSLHERLFHQIVSWNPSWFGFEACPAKNILMYCSTLTAKNNLLPTFHFECLFCCLLFCLLF